MPRSQLAASLVLAIAAAMLTLPGCKGESGGGGTGGAGTGDSAVPPTGGGGFDIGSVGETAGKAFNDLKSRFSGAVSEAETKIAALKTKADTLKDERLNTLMGSINAKLTEVKAAVKSMVDSGSDATRSTVEKLVGELNAMIEQGAKRADELSAG